MYLYAVCLNGQVGLDDWWIEFYWAEDQEHAEEQAHDANRESAIVCVAIVPAQDGGYLKWRDGVND